MEQMMEETLAPTDRPRIDEEQLVLDWRVGQLERLGVSRLSALAFAARIDWHEIAALVQHGCSPELAVDIVR